MYHQIARNKRNSIFVIVGFLLVWLAAGLIIGAIASGQSGAIGGAIILGLLGVAAALYAYYFGSATVLSAMGAQEADPRQFQQLYNVVQALAIGDGLPMPKVYVIPTDAPNAFATGRSPKHAAVAATDGILRLLSDSELEGVIGHELAHVQHRDILTSSVAATIAAAIMMLASVARWGLIFGGAGGPNEDRRRSNALVLLATAILAPLAALVIQAAISRSREFAADQGGAGIAGGPHGLAQALQKIDTAARAAPLVANPATAHLFIINPLSARGLMALFSTHPPTEERIARLLAG